MPLQRMLPFLLCLLARIQTKSIWPERRSPGVSTHVRMGKLCDVKSTLNMSLIKYCLNMQFPKQNDTCLSLKFLAKSVAPAASCSHPRFPPSIAPPIVPVHWWLIHFSPTASLIVLVISCVLTLRHTILIRPPLRLIKVSSVVPILIRPTPTRSLIPIHPSLSLVHLSWAVSSIVLTLLLPLSPRHCAFLILVLIFTLLPGHKFLSQSPGTGVGARIQARRTARWGGADAGSNGDVQPRQGLLGGGGPLRSMFAQVMDGTKNKNKPLDTDTARHLS
jgi:hypothetical protein